MHCRSVGPKHTLLKNVNSNGVFKSCRKNRFYELNGHECHRNYDWETLNFLLSVRKWGERSFGVDGKFVEVKLFVLLFIIKHSYVLGLAI